MTRYNDIMRIIEAIEHRKGLFVSRDNRQIVIIQHCDNNEITNAIEEIERNCNQVINFRNGKKFVFEQFKVLFIEKN